MTCWCALHRQTTQLCVCVCVCVYRCVCELATVVMMILANFGNFNTYISCMHLLDCIKLQQLLLHGAPASRRSISVPPATKYQRWSTSGGTGTTKMESRGMQLRNLYKHSVAHITQSDTPCCCSASQHTLLPLCDDRAGGSPFY